MQPALCCTRVSQAKPAPATFAHLTQPTHLLLCTHTTRYYRVYSPVTFGKKYDPEGRFIRRFVPQLARLPAKYIYEPHLAPLDVQQRWAAASPPVTCCH